MYVLISRRILMGSKRIMPAAVCRRHAMRIFLIVEKTRLLVDGYL